MKRRTAIDLPTILHVATEIANTQGLDHVTLASLSMKLGIRPPSLYNHVDGLPGLRTKLTIHGLAQLNSALTQAAVGRSGDEAIREIAKAYVSFARSHPGLYAATLSAPDPSEPELQQAAEETLRLILRVIQHYGLEDDAALHAVRIFRSLLHGFASLEQAGGFGLPLDLNVTFQHLIDTLLASIHLLQPNGVSADYG